MREVDGFLAMQMGIPAGIFLYLNFITNNFANDSLSVVIAKNNRQVHIV